MIKKIILQKVTGVTWAGGTLNTFALINPKNFKPYLAPSLWLLHLAKSNRSINTIETYASALSRFLCSATNLGNADAYWQDISDRDMSAYLRAHLVQRKFLKNNSIKLTIVALDSFYIWAFEHGFLEKQPAFTFDFDPNDSEKNQGGYIKKEIGLLHTTYMTIDNFNELLQQVDSTNLYINERNCLAFKLGYYAGLRASEVVSCPSFDTKKLKKILKETNHGASLDFKIKGKGCKIRVVNFPPILIEDIRRFLFGRRSKVPDGELICKQDGTELNRKFASSLFRSAADKNNGKEWRVRSFHVLRKCYATNLVTWCIENGISEWQLVPERLGHNNNATTRIYIFFEALMNSRKKRIEQLSLDHAQYKNIWGKSSNV
jgi:site-specific recombinase XerD